MFAGSAEPVHYAGWRIVAGIVHIAEDVDLEKRSPVGLNVRGVLMAVEIGSRAKFNNERGSFELRYLRYFLIRVRLALPSFPAHDRGKYRKGKIT